MGASERPVSDPATAGAAKVSVFEDPKSRDLLHRIKRLAPSNITVLISGETGTGKEIVARQIHELSPRRDRPFCAVNCGAIPESLVESELFGHERGAFTGAASSNPGWFESANGGTLFLDEIGDLPASVQVRLLRVLQEREVVRLGSRRAVPLDVRLIAATHVNLTNAVTAGRFREDLFFRLSVASVELLPLRERRGDILPLARAFLQAFASELGVRIPALDATAQALLLQHDWRGNVRELENAIHRAIVSCEGPVIGPEDLALRPAPIQLVVASERPTPVPRDERAAWAAIEQAFDDLLPRGLPDLHSRVEAMLLSAAFRYSGNNQLETARLLGLSRHVARARLIEHGQLQTPSPRSARARPLATPGEATTLRIGYQALGLLSLVRAFGAFDEVVSSRALSVVWREYAGGIQIVDALRRGELDLGVVGDCPAVYAQADGVPVVYVASEPPARQAAAVIVPQHSSLRSISDLRGKRVAVNRAAQAHLLLVLALEEAGVDLDDIELCFETPARAVAAFREGEIDAWAIWDPWLSSARIDLHARVLRDTSGLFESSVYYLARKHFADARPDVVAELRTQLLVVARWAQSDPGRAARLVAPSLGLSPGALVASLDRELRSNDVTPGQIVAQQRIADQCARLRLIPRSVSVAAAQWLPGPAAARSA